MAGGSDSSAGAANPERPVGRHFGRVRDEPVFEPVGFAEMREDGSIDYSIDPEAVKAATEL